MENTHLTPYQQAHLDTRALHDAELITGGARHNERGQLILHLAQVELLCRENITAAEVEKFLKDTAEGYEILSHQRAVRPIPTH